MKYYFSLYIFIFFGTVNVVAQSNNLNVENWLRELANSVEMEVVTNCDTPYINKLGSIGSLYVEGIIHTSDKVFDEKGNWHNKSMDYILFFGKYLDQSKMKESSTIFNLIFATKNGTKEANENYEVIDIFEGVQLTGMHLLTGQLDIDSFCLFKEKLADESNPELLAININNSWTRPIIIPYRNGGKSVLIYHNYNWFISDQID